MKTYTIAGHSGSAAAIVRELHEGSRAPAKDDKTWMIEVAARIKLLNGHQVRVNHPEDFLDDIIELELLDALTGK